MLGIRPAIIRGALAGTEKGLAHAIVGELAQPHVVLARMWIAEADGTCELAASAGFPTGGGSYNRIDGEFRRVAGGVGKIGRIASDRTALIVRSIRGDEDWLSNPTWIARQGIRAFVGLPLAAADIVVGVLAIFDRIAPSDAAIGELQFLADYAAARITEIRSRVVSGAGSAPVTRSGSVAFASARTQKPASSGETSPEILTRARLRELEKQAIEAALTQTAGKVFGPDGAAALLAMKPTTLASRIKALGLRMR